MPSNSDRRSERAALFKAITHVRAMAHKIRDLRKEREALVQNRYKQKLCELYTRQTDYICDQHDLEIAALLELLAAVWENDLNESLALCGTEEFAEMRHQLRSQDNTATSDPIFLVREAVRHYGIEEDYGGEPVWVNVDGDDADEEQFERFERGEFLEDDGESESWRRTAYKDHYEYVTACFTRQAAEEYVNSNRHRLRDPHVYVASGYRNRQWQRIRTFLLGKLPPQLLQSRRLA